MTALLRALERNASRRPLLWMGPLVATAAVSGFVVLRALDAPQALCPEGSEACQQTPVDEEDDPSVIALEAVIARAQALVRGGQPTEALELLERGGRAEGAATLHPSVQARFHYALGATYTALGRGEEADEALQHAYWRASAQGQHEVAFLASRDLASILLRAHALEQAQRWIRQAQAQNERLGAPAGPAADVLLVQGNLYTQRRELDEALEVLTRAQQLHARAGIENATTLTIAHNIAIAVGRRSGPDRALPLHVANLARRREQLGSSHPDVADSLLSVAANQVELNAYDEAIGNFEEASSIYERALGPESDAVLDTLENLAGTFALTGRIEDARTSFTRLRDLAERTDDALLAGHVSVNLGDLGLMSQRPEDAEREFRRALRHLESRLDPTDPLIAHAIGGIGEAYLASERASAAVDYLQRSLAIRAEHPTDIIPLARARIGLARALWDSGEDPRRARELALRAREALPEREGRASQVREYIDAWLGDHEAPSPS